jgi:hypothetical protein
MASCERNSEAALFGKWKPVDIELNDPTGIRSRPNSGDEMYRRIYEFRKDGTLAIFDGGILPYEITPFTTVQEENDLYLLIKAPAEVSRYKILGLSGSELVMRDHNNVYTYHFRRQ